MDLGSLFIDFFQPVAVGAGTVFLLLVITSIGLPRRSTAVAQRRTIR